MFLEDLLSLLNLQEISTSLANTRAFVKNSFLKKRKHSIATHSFTVMTKREAIAQKKVFSNLPKFHASFPSVPPFFLNSCQHNLK